jgi:hypothetical protein
MMKQHRLLEQEIEFGWDITHKLSESIFDFLSDTVEAQVGFNFDFYNEQEPFKTAKEAISKGQGFE